MTEERDVDGYRIWRIWQGVPWFHYAAACYSVADLRVLASSWEGFLDPR
jgi:hypothetical protein